MNQPLPAEQIANQELITQVLTQILQEKPSLIASVVTNACQCHWIDPSKMRMLLWKDKDTYILKIAEQKFVGVARQDKRGEIYWKFRELYESESKETQTETNSSSISLAPEQPPLAKKPMSMYSQAELERINKFKERQAKAQAFQAQKEKTSMSANEYLAQLAKERAEREAQANTQSQENHVHHSTSTTESAN